MKESSLFHSAVIADNGWNNKLIGDELIVLVLCGIGFFKSINGAIEFKPLALGYGVLYAFLDSSPLGVSVHSVVTAGNVARRPTPISPQAFYMLP